MTKRDLTDYCAHCVRDYDCGRMETLTTPYLTQWDGSTVVRAWYECSRGHSWQCLWSAALGGNAA